MTASANHSISQTGLKRRSVVLMIVFAILTFSFYYPIWFLRRRTALNQLDSPRKLRLWPFVVCFASVAVQFVFALAFGSARLEQTIGPGPALLYNLVQFGVAILMVVQTSDRRPIRTCAATCRSPERLALHV